MDETWFDIEVACPATDLAAQLEAQLDRARLRLRACELEMRVFARPLSPAAAVRGGRSAVPAMLIEQFRHHRAEIAALRHVLADLRGEGVRDAACA